MINWNGAWLGVIIHPSRRRNRNTYGLEVFFSIDGHTSEIATFPALPKDIADRCLDNIVLTAHGDEVEFGVLMEVIGEMVTGGVPFVRH